MQQAPGDAGILAYAAGVLDRASLEAWLDGVLAQGGGDGSAAMADAAAVLRGLQGGVRPGLAGVARLLTAIARLSVDGVDGVDGVAGVNRAIQVAARVCEVDDLICQELLLCERCQREYAAATSVGLQSLPGVCAGGGPPRICEHF
jgi:hypothetical protein